MEWDPVDPAAITIAHLSDVHFGSADVDVTWSNLRHALETIAPSLVLISGDLVNSPKDAAFDDASSKIRLLGRPTYVCAGNHDRHWWGNALFGLGRRRSPFEKHFPSEHRYRHAVLQAKRKRGPPPKPPAALSLGVVPTIFEIQGTRLRLAALDSSLTSLFSARGFVTLVQANELEQAANHAPPSDFAILLCHHHLIPVRALEHSVRDRGRFWDLMSVMNAGTVLERIASANFDVVLHGHRHHENLAAYGSLSGAKNHSVIVGAGSATGAETLEPCDPNRATFNVLVLNPDRSCELRVLGHRDAEWRTNRKTLVCEPESVRRRRLVRSLLATHGKVSFRQELSGRVVKTAEFTSMRDILISETRHDWELESIWDPQVSNGTGIPIDPAIDIAPAEPPYRLRLQFDPVANATNPTWGLKVLVPAFLVKQKKRVRFEYKWLGGALLTKQELIALAPPSSLAKDLRNRGLEWSSVTPRGAARLAQLFLDIPPEHAPGGVSVKLLDHDDAVVAEDTSELRGYLTQLSPSRYLLSVPYPEEEGSYVLAWEPPPYRLSSDALRFAGLSVASLRRIVEKLLASCEGTLLAEANVALCLLTPGLKTVRAVTQHDESERPLLAGSEGSALVQAFWGRSELFQRPTSREGRTATEEELETLKETIGLDEEDAAIVCAPIYAPLHPQNRIQQPIALLRLGLRNSFLGDHQDLPQREELERALRKLIGCALTHSA